MYIRTADVIAIGAVCTLPITLISVGAPTHSSSGAPLDTSNLPVSHTVSSFAWKNLSLLEKNFFIDQPTAFRKKFYLILFLMHYILFDKDLNLTYDPF